jgi:hypothetical protein
MIETEFQGGFRDKNNIQKNFLGFIRLIVDIKIIKNFFLGELYLR